MVEQVMGVTKQALFSPALSFYAWLLDLAFTRFLSPSMPWLLPWTAPRRSPRRRSRRSSRRSSTTRRTRSSFAKSRARS